MAKLSVIVCSRTGSLSPDLSQNIRETIGCEYETVVIDNSNGQYSIFQAYNKGLDQSRFKYVCLLHDDVFIHTPDWGKTLITLLDDNPAYGLIGVAGARLKTKTVSGWWECKEEYKMVNIIQHFPNKKVERQYFGFGQKDLVEAVAVDGVFLGMRKEAGCHFNDDLKGFHCYDLNIGFEFIKKGYKLGVTNKVLLEHYSLGNVNNQWLSTNIQVHRMYNKLLPLNLTGTDLKAAEVYSTKKLIDKCKLFRRKRLFIYHWGRLLFMDPSSKKHVKLLRNIKKRLLYR